MHSLDKISSYTFQPYIFLYRNSCTPSLHHCTIGPHCTAVCFVYCHQISDICNSIYISTVYLYRTHSEFSGAQFQFLCFTATSYNSFLLTRNFSFCLIFAAHNTPYSPLNLQMSPSHNALTQLSP